MLVYVYYVIPENISGPSLGFSQDVCQDWENKMEVAHFLHFFINHPFSKLRPPFWMWASHTLPNLSLGLGSHGPRSNDVPVFIVSFTLYICYDFL